MIALLIKVVLAYLLTVTTLMLGIGIILLGYGLYEPASYSIVRRVTTPKTSAMGFAMLYALIMGLACAQSYSSVEP